MNAQELETGVQIGDFRIERRLGAGGMGVVYQARQISLDRPVALKVLGVAMSEPAHIWRFRREAQAVAKLHHPAIATLYYAGQDEYACYMAMELIDGFTLRELITSLGSTHNPHLSIPTALKQDSATNSKPPRINFAELTVPEKDGAVLDSRVALQAITLEADAAIASRDYVRTVCEIVRDAAVALHHAHDQGVIHRDIKPSNIMLDRQGQSHIIDFGVAWFFEAEVVTAVGQLVGTPMYMSPEQIAGSHVDHRSDIYSLGLTMYELLTLRRPLHAPTREAVLRGIITKTMVPVSWKNTGVPREVENIVHKAITKDPDERYQSAADFAADLQRSLHGEPVVASSYRYKFDEREIVAERPWEVVASAFWFYFVAVFYALIWCPYWEGQAIDWPPAVPPIFPATPAEHAQFIAGCLGLVVGACAVAWGLLSARVWSRWLAIPVVVLVTGLSLRHLRELVLNAWMTKSASGLLVSSFWLVSRSAIVLGGCFDILVLVLARRPKAWFTRSRELRFQHHQLAPAVEKHR